MLADRSPFELDTKLVPAPSIAGLVSLSKLVTAFVNGLFAFLTANDPYCDLREVECQLLEVALVARSGSRLNGKV